LITHNRQPPATLAVALGANLPSPAGAPLDTLLVVRPLLETLLQDLGHSTRWSPVFRTAPVGGPEGQDDYLNAVVIAAPLHRTKAHTEQALAAELLTSLQSIEMAFGRQRHLHWGPRSLDLDLLWWGDLHCRSQTLDLPHPHLLERTFVLAPLAAIDPELVPPGTQVPVAALLAQLQAASPGPAPARLARRPGWPE
jgi:2-amino-4-hydroxy-6-hydroxymethyldihydropteridine diphosphokinase